MCVIILNMRTSNTFTTYLVFFFKLKLANLFTILYVGPLDSFVKYWLPHIISLRQPAFLISIVISSFNLQKYITVLVIVIDEILLQFPQFLYWLVRDRQLTF